MTKIGTGWEKHISKRSATPHPKGRDPSIPRQKMEPLTCARTVWETTTRQPAGPVTAAATYSWLHVRTQKVPISAL